MRCYYLVVLCLLLTRASTEPDPKKYKPEKDGEKQGLTSDERKFLREVEEKFGVKSDVPVETESEKVEDQKTEVDESENNSTESNPKLFPAVIAIEIFNDTDTKTKGKRTIDANLGYGYQTNNGYSYNYFGKSGHEKGKFMIYPYSQQDIPGHLSVQPGKYSSPESEYSPHASSVEIQPSQAFELVEVNKEESRGYNYQVPSNPLKTKYEEIEKPAQTLYTTYNGQEFSGLSQQFPSVMPDYFVDPRQLLKNPHYQGAGLTQDHLHAQHPYTSANQRIVPVLVLRVPSSYLKNPTAELYADLPKNYPLSQHLNTVNLQALVNQYFKKNGYPFAPKIMNYQNSLLSQGAQVTGHYSNSYPSPAFSHSDYSGINYSAAQPVATKYSSYSQQQAVPQQHAVYEHPTEQQQYQYQFASEPQIDSKAQAYYDPSQYSQLTNVESSAYQGETADHQANLQDASQAYATSQQSDQDSKVNYESYASPHASAQANYEDATPGQHDSAHGQEQAQDTPSSEYGPVKVEIPTYSSQYYESQNEQKEPVSVLPSRLIHSENYQVNPSSGAAEYSYDTQSRDASLAGLSENYPSKDHTIATAYPYQGKTVQSSVQTVSYVTPTPNAKYQSQYRVMVPQTVLSNPSGSAHLSALHYLQQASQLAAAQSAQSHASSQSRPHTHYTYSKRMTKPSRKGSRKPSRKHSQTKTTTSA
ncbi:uncharacterized protein LOC121735011 [Aricia agestis]|uniref:uncharacterized protein LOC121735011 n=1 Tax=Aricia agestis TaxID=91739 RepID=UPI001C20214B|nr:uncharacterized protein LOC121735011 [Aricia agestis]